MKLKRIIYETCSKVTSKPLYSVLDSSQLQKKGRVEMSEQNINHFGILAP